MIRNRDEHDNDAHMRCPIPWPGRYREHPSYAREDRRTRRVPQRARPHRQRDHCRQEQAPPLASPYRPRAVGWIGRNTVCHWDPWLGPFETGAGGMRIHSRSENCLRLRRRRDRLSKVLARRLTQCYCLGLGATSADCSVSIKAGAASMGISLLWQRRGRADKTSTCAPALISYRFQLGPWRPSPRFWSRSRSAGADRLRARLPVHLRTARSRRHHLRLAR